MSSRCWAVPPMAELKTRATDASVDAFVDAVENPARRKDARTVLALMEKITNREPRMWGSSIVGFGSYTYTYASGRSGEWPLVGFSPRKQALTLYVMPGFDDYQDLLDELGEFRTGKSCLYIKSLAKVDQKILTRILRKSVAQLRKKWPTT